MSAAPLQGLPAFLRALAQDSVSQTNRDALAAWASEVEGLSAAHADHRRLVRELDVALNGEGAAAQALPAAAPVAQAAVASETLTERLQQKCSGWGTYWRAPDAHGVNLTVAQAGELLQEALGVEVWIELPSSPAVVHTADI